MKRSLQSTRKEQLQEEILNYLIKHGVANLSLRPLAAKIGTSPRILIFHFKSKEELIQDVLAELNTRLQASLSAMASSDSGPDPDALLKRFWQWATSKENFPYLRLLYEVQIIAAQNPVEYAGYLKKMSMDWQAITIQCLSQSIRTEPTATLCIAVFDGLFIELMSTGDRARLTRALDHFISMVRMTAPTEAAKTSRARRSQGQRRT